ncbi:MAG: hypothetical protein RIS64_1154, partial [Bacteroidota bacterium]
MNFMALKQNLISFFLIFQTFYEFIYQTPCALRVFSGKCVAS